MALLVVFSESGVAGAWPLVEFRSWSSDVEVVEGRNRVVETGELDEGAGNCERELRVEIKGDAINEMSR